MKKIKIYQRDASDVELLDDSDEDIDVYCHELSKMFQMSNVVILKTSSSTFVGRPSQLSGIVVEDDQTDATKTIEPTVKKPVEKVKPKEIVEDIITDIE